MGSNYYNIDYTQPSPHLDRSPPSPKAPSTQKRPGIPQQWKEEQLSPTKSSRRPRVAPKKPQRYNSFDSQSSITVSTYPEQQGPYGTVLISGPSSAHTDWSNSSRGWGLDTQSIKDVDDLFSSQAMPPPPIPKQQTSRKPSPPAFTTFARSTPPPTCTPSFLSLSSQNSNAPLYNHNGQSPTRSGYSGYSPYGSPYTSPTRSFPQLPPQTGSPVSYTTSPDRSRFQNHSHDGQYGTGYFKDVDIMNEDREIFPPPSPSKKGSSHFPSALRHGLGISWITSIGSKTRDTSGNYGRVPVTPGKWKGGRFDYEKGAWQEQPKKDKKKAKWLIGAVFAFVVVAAIIGGSVGSITAHKAKPEQKTPVLAKQHSGLYDIDSDEVKVLLNNKDLHRVFPGIDYTPSNAQYPACLTTPPDQNNITLDLAILSQLTPSIRLYGNDCNQTDLLLTAAQKLSLPPSSLKIWLGVWISQNETTNARQMTQMYDILAKYPTENFAGIIYANEALHHDTTNATHLAADLIAIRNNLTTMHIDLPIATSQFPNQWTEALAAASDITMTSIHPFLSGQDAKHAAGWAWSENAKAAKLPSPDHEARVKWPKSVVGEIGWPSVGGESCEGSCAHSNSRVNVKSNSTAAASDGEDGEVTVDGMNTFMEEWVCGSLRNGTTFFWTDPFLKDPEVKINAKTDRWESAWGFLDEERKVKDGVKIPECEGKRVDVVY